MENETESDGVVLRRVDPQCTLPAGLSDAASANTILKHVGSRSIGERIITCLRRADGQQRRERPRTNACKFKHGAEIASRGRAFRCDKERFLSRPMRGLGGVSLAGTRAEGEQKVTDHSRTKGTLRRQYRSWEGLLVVRLVGAARSSPFATGHTRPWAWRR